MSKTFIVTFQGDYEVKDVSLHDPDSEMDFPIGTDSIEEFQLLRVSGENDEGDKLEDELFNVTTVEHNDFGDTFLYGDFEDNDDL